MSNLINKAKDALSGHKGHDTTTATTTSFASGTVNRIDPTIDSRTGTSANAAGPHSSNLVNKLDPRVDSDADHRANPNSAVGGYGSSEHGITPTTTAGPHSSNLANKLDPQVDSDVDHRNNPASRVGGYGETQGTIGGAGVTSTDSGYGPTAQAGGVTGTTGATGDGTGGAACTHVHDSKLLNKLDPRVKTNGGY